MTQPTGPDADNWFVNLEELAKRVEKNGRNDHRARGRQYALALFTLFGLMLLAIRSEKAFDRLDAVDRRVEAERKTTRYESCLSGLEVITKYNEAQLLQSDLELRLIKADPGITPELRKVREDRAAVYARGILPIPSSDGLKP